MCLVLPARVLSREGQSAEIELHDGQRVSASTELAPDVQPGQYVLVDRGVVVRVIEPEEAQAVLAIYAEMAELLDDEPPGGEDDGEIPSGWGFPSSSSAPPADQLAAAGDAGRPR